MRLVALEGMRMPGDQWTLGTLAGMMTLGTDGDAQG